MKREVNTKIAVHMNAGIASRLYGQYSAKYLGQDGQFEVYLVTARTANKLLAENSPDLVKPYKGIL